MIRDPFPRTFIHCQRPDTQSCSKPNIARQNRISFAGTKKIQRSGSGAESSLQNLVFQKNRSRKSRFKQKPIFPSLLLTYMDIVYW